MSCGCVKWPFCKGWLPLPFRSYSFQDKSPSASLVSQEVANPHVAAPLPWVRTVCPAVRKRGARAPTACFLQPHLAIGLLWWRGREESTGTSKPIGEAKNVSQSAVSKASLALEGRMVQESGFQNRSRALALSACSSNPFICTRRVDSGTWPCVPGGDGAGAAPQNVCRRSADARP
jgi:hypothetical protein